MLSQREGPGPGPLVQNMVNIGPRPGAPRSQRVNLIQYIFNDSYAYSFKKAFLNKYKCAPGKDGLVDTIDTLLKDYTVKSSEFIAKIILIMVK